MLPTNILLTLRKKQLLTLLTLVVSFPLSEVDTLPCSCTNRGMLKLLEPGLETRHLIVFIFTTMRGFLEVPARVPHLLLEGICFHVFDSDIQRTQPQMLLAIYLIGNKWMVDDYRTTAEKHESHLFFPSFTLTFLYPLESDGYIRDQATNHAFLPVAACRERNKILLNKKTSEGEGRVQGQQTACASRTFLSSYVKYKFSLSHFFRKIFSLLSHSRRKENAHNQDQDCPSVKISAPCGYRSCLQSSRNKGVYPAERRVRMWKLRLSFIKLHCKHLFLFL